ncbi:MAG: TonB-dependent receptor plug domain-containing protein, partial [Bacteroidaceae bacterium]|nr:TonB-dependent receptor plug domain-containing protein [Bacteroidaceae bacterium]
MNHIKYLLTIALCFCFTALVAQKRISGHVWSQLDGPVMMANVVELDKSNRVVSATQTDASGNFSLAIKNPANILQISYIGYSVEKLPIGNTTTFKVELKDNSMLKEAVVTQTRKVKSNGLTIPEREISVAQQSLNMDEMAGLSFTTAGEALQGQIAGLDIVSNSGNLGAGTSMRLRGVTSINGSSEPLIVVDGYILEDDSYNSDDFDPNNMDEQKFANLLRVSVDDIQSIQVLKDASASAIYGARGSNGVIEIKTRRGARGKTKVNFSYLYNMAWQPEGYKMLDGDGYTMMLKEAYFNPKQSDVA